MITVRTSPQYVNRVRQDWMANGGVYGDGGISALVPSNDPFAQLGPTLDLTFAGNPTDLLTASTTAGYTLDTYFTPETYQIAVPYAIWEDGVGLAQKTFAQIVTFTRASTATYFNSAGTLTSAAINEARFDYNPSTLAPLGFLIEESRTNSIRNNTMVGAVAGTPGTVPTNWGVTGTADGIATQVVGTGAENGITYIDLRYSGTATATSFKIVRFEAINNIAAASGQTWTAATYMRVAAGSAANITAQEHVVVGYNAGGTAVEQTNTPPTVTSTMTRFITSRTLNNATTAFVASYYAFTFNNGAAIDITLRIGLPQLEQGAFATSVIPTTTTALTRSADVASVNTLSPWYNATEGTLYVQGILVGGTAATFPYQTALVGSNANNDSIGVSWTAPNSNMRFGVRSGGVAQCDIPIIPSKVAGNTFKMAGRYANNDFQASSDGNLGTPDTSGSLPTITALSLGGPVSFQPGASVWLQRVTYYPRPLANADLQTITT
jgi:hypothetical protein